MSIEFILDKKHWYPEPHTCGTPFYSISKLLLLPSKPFRSQFSIIESQENKGIVTEVCVRLSLRNTSTRLCLMLSHSLAVASEVDSSSKDHITPYDGKPNENNLT